MQYEIGQANLLGNRHSNQDRFKAIETEHGVLLVLGDGMGGQASGEVAAQILIDTADEIFQAQSSMVRDVNRLFRAIILQSGNSRVARQPQAGSVHSACSISRSMRILCCQAAIPWELAIHRCAPRRPLR